MQFICNRVFVLFHGTDTPKHCYGRTFQMLRIMKLTLTLLTVFILQANAEGISQTVTISATNMSLEKICLVIKKQTGYSFFYTVDLWKDTKPVSIHVKNEPLPSVLKLIFDSQPLTYKVEDKTIIIVRKSGAIENGSKSNNVNDEIDFNGKVVSKNGEPLAGASVVVKRTGNGTQTDAKGNFSLQNINPNDEIIISYTGYTDQSIIVGSRKSFTFILNIAENELDEVIMQGYGKTTRRLATGNIAKVSAEEISKQPVINPLQALQGRVAGLVVTQTSGYGSAPFKVELRGRSTINRFFTSDPLYIIDGVPITISEINGQSSYLTGSSGFLQNNLTTPAGGQSPLFSINPNDIESIEVLKDAEATSIYGSRAANGVILITTKKGKPGKIKFTGSISHGINKITRKWDMLNTEQYLEMRKEAFKNDGIAITPLNAYDILIWDTTKYTDWQDYVYNNTGKVKDAQIGISGGDNQITYRIGTGYSHRTSITSASGADQRLSVSTNLSLKTLNRRFTLSLNNNFTYTSSDMVSMPGSSTPLLPPNAPDVYDSAGNLNYKGWKPRGLPFSNLFQPYTSKTRFLNSNLILSYEVVKGLTIRSSFGYNTTNVNQKIFSPISSLDPTRGTQTGTASFGANEINNWLIEPQIEYNNFIAKQNFTVLIGSTIQANATTGSSVTGTGYTSDLLLKTISNAPSQVSSQFYGQYRYSGLFGRINYNISSKYLISLSARRDGSSRFGKEKQFGNFGAVGIGWILSEEKFIKGNLNFLSFAKIRGSYGTTGSDAIGDYQYLTRWSSTDVYSYAGISPIVPLQHLNTRYHWPTNRKLETAVDIGLFKDRISFSVAWYRNRCNDQLLSLPIGTYTGFGSVTANSPANVQNSGVEFQATAKIINSKSIVWNINVNTGINRNKLLSYPNIEQSPYAQQLIVGKSLNIIRRLHYTGVDPQTGFYTVEDKTKDGSIRTNYGDADDRFVYEIDPKLTGGLGTNCSYYGVDISLFFSFVKQKYGLNAFFTNGATPGSISNSSSYIFNKRWQKPGDISEFAKFTTTPNSSYSNFYQSDGVYTDASYIRLSTVAIGYNIPHKILDKVGFESVKISASAQNLLTITKYKGLDPETQNFGGMPPAKTIIAGITFNF